MLSQMEKQISKNDVVATSIGEDKRDEEHILGSFASSVTPDLKYTSRAYHIFVTDKRIMGIKLRPNGSVPKTIRQLETPEGRIDFSIPRSLIFRVTMRNAVKNKNVFVIQTRNGNALKLFLKHSTNKELQKEKELFLEGFKLKS
jgi:hypothetical protein